MYSQPAKKLLFMGGEFGQWNEWYHEVSLDWHLLDYPPHAAMQRWVRDLNRLYRAERALHELDFSPAGFEWIDCNDSQQSILSLMRRGRSTEDIIIAVLNFTPVPRDSYRVGAPRGGFWREVLNSDAKVYGGTGWGNFGGLVAEAVPFHGRPFSINLTLPPVGAVFLKSEG
jgi:1,4-alpha-glucan branching enzyme